MWCDSIKLNYTYELIIHDIRKKIKKAMDVWIFGC